MITNVIYRSEQAGEFNYLLDAGGVEIVEVFEDGISFMNINDELVTEDCTFEGNAAVIIG